MRGPVSALAAVLLVLPACSGAIDSDPLSSKTAVPGNRPIKGMDPVGLIRSSAGPDYQTALREFAKCPYSESAKISLVESSEPILASDEKGVRISGTYIRAVVDAALEAEFTDASEVREMIARNDLYGSTVALPRKQGRVAVSFEVPVRGGTQPLADRLVHVFSPFVCSVWSFGLLHELGHHEHKDFDKRIRSCDQLQDIEYEADRYAALKMNFLFMYLRDSGDGVLNTFVAAKTGISYLDIGLTFHRFGFGTHSGLPGCSYPTTEERMRRVKKFVEESRVSLDFGKKGDPIPPRVYADTKAVYDKLPAKNQSFAGGWHYPNVVFETLGNVISDYMAAKSWDSPAKCIDACKASPGCVAVNFNNHDSSCQHLDRVFSWKDAPGYEAMIARKELCPGGKLPCGSGDGLPWHAKAPPNLLAKDR